MNIKAGREPTLANSLKAKTCSISKVAIVDLSTLMESDISIPALVIGPLIVSLTLTSVHPTRSLHYGFNVLVSIPNQTCDAAS
jgi:hypothetical protein